MIALSVILPASCPVPYALERNHLRRPHPRPRLFGAHHLDEPDVDRITADLRCLAHRGVRRAAG